MININEMTVLLVDDMPNMINSIQKILKILGFGRIFLHAGNGEEALRTLRKQPVDMAIIDYDMPVMTGVECLREIREDRDLRDLPVIMVTANTERDFVMEVAEAEVNDYILKPVTIKTLENKIPLVIEEANNPPPMVYHLRKARQFEEEGRIDDALNETLAAVEADPKSSRPVRDTGYYYLKKGDLKEAEKWLYRAAKMNTLDVFAFHHLGSLYLALNNIEKALYYFEKAIKISPRHLTRNVQFGKTLIAQKAVDKAIKIFERTFKLSDSPIRLKEEIADFCISSGANEYASSLLESIIRDQPNRTDLSMKLDNTLKKIYDQKEGGNPLYNSDKTHFTAENAVC